MTTSLIMLLVALVLPYVVGPVLIRTRPGIKARRCFVQVTDEAARLHFPPQSFRAIAQLEEMGFSFITHLISGDEITRVNSTLSLLVNRSSNTIALVCRAFTSNRTVNKSIEFVAFSTEFADGSEIGTSNSPIAGV